MTKALNRSQWSADPRALAAIEKECQGLRSNETWDDSTVCDLDQLIYQSKTLGQNVRIAELLVLCGIKHAELDESKHKYKGRIVYRGDKVFTQNGDIVLFTEVSTSPTTLIALNVCLWWGALEGHATSTADAVQAFLQSYLPEMSSRSLFCHGNCGWASGNPNSMAKLPWGFESPYTDTRRLAAYGKSFWRPGSPELELNKSRGSLATFCLTLMATECFSTFMSMTWHYQELRICIPSFGSGFLNSSRSRIHKPCFQTMQCSF